MCNLHSVRVPIRIAGEDDVAPPGEQAGKALEGLAAHDHRRAHGHFLEVPEVGRDVPGKGAVLADHAIVGAGDDEDDLGHTATGAAMCGWGSYSLISKSSYWY